MKQAYFLLILFTGSSLQACRHDTADYQMADDEFISAVYPEIIYQRQLNLVMIDAVQDMHLSQYGQKRDVALQSYLQELMVTDPDYDKQITLSDEHNRMLAILKQQVGAMQKDMLLKLLIDSDQLLIGLHVKASGPVGLKNADLRSWAEKRIAHWTQDLSGLQVLDGL